MQYGLKTDCNQSVFYLVFETYTTLKTTSALVLRVLFYTPLLKLIVCLVRFTIKNFTNFIR